MINSNALKEISNIFIGDNEKWYSYKTGPMLVLFFNQYFNYADNYYQGFPSRWIYVHDKLVELQNTNKIDRFFNVILSKDYYLSDSKLTEVTAIPKLNEIHREINSLLRPYSYVLNKKGNQYHLCSINEDLEFIGSGGFANVYLQKSTGFIVKKSKKIF